MSEKNKIVVGISGGIDSACVAKRFKDDGKDVYGVFLRMFPGQSETEAVKAAEEIGIPLCVIDCAARFEENVIAPFLAEYANGRTPNPCVLCNPAVKLGVLCEYADECGIEHVATGHYCKIEHDPQTGRRYVRSAENAAKDQSYMLWKLTQHQLSKLVTPLNGEDKETLREYGRNAGLSASASKDSQDICFLPNGDYAAFAEKRLGKFKKGHFVTENGDVIGEHRGIIHYTVGQRRGLGVSAASRLFVRSIDLVSNTVVLSEKDAYAESFTVENINFQRAQEVRDGDRFYCKVRYAAPRTGVTVYHAGEGIRCVCDEPIRAVTPGQSAVFYDTQDTQSAVMFGGIIQNATLI